jgi:hypothetical protein
VSTTTKPAYGQPALVGGVVMGVLSALPLVYFGNVCCCMWVVCGGLAAAYVLQQNTSTPISPADGALVGLLAGLAGAVVHLLLSIPIDILASPYERTLVQRLIGVAGTMPPEMRDTIERAMNQRQHAGIGFLLAGRMFIFILMLCIGSVFSTIGGLIGSMLFKRSTPPNTFDVAPLN